MSEVADLVPAQTVGQLVATAPEQCSAPVLVRGVRKPPLSEHLAAHRQDDREIGVSGADNSRLDKPVILHSHSPDDVDCDGASIADH
ncbi:hypothetical protein AB0C40_17365 [Streptomyces brevispora]|uniref:hypothetical protein n=1 Tax=Streptomyces brevispora TaxID=887462 RepID=UPI0033DBCB22